MTEQSFDNHCRQKGHTFAETSSDEKIDWLAGYLDTLASQAFSAEVSGGTVQDLRRDLEMAKKLLLQIRHQIVAEDHALHDRLGQHGDYVIVQSAHDLSVYWEPDGTPATAQEIDSQA